MDTCYLKGQTAFLTGASRGLGLAIAHRLAQAGADLALVARDRTALTAAANAVIQASPLKSQEIRCYPLDLANEQEVDRGVAAYLSDFGSVDILVNNAAIQGPIGPFEQADWPAWCSVFQVNFLAPARLCRLLIPGMKRQGRGKIINLSGGGATGPRPDFSAYAAAKCALVRLTETLADELKESNIQVNAVAPGAMNTAMLQAVLAAGPTGATREYHKARDQERNGGTPPDQVAALVAWLTSAASAGITGRLLSAVWDNWADLPSWSDRLAKSDIFTLRRITPEDRPLAG